MRGKPGTPIKLTIVRQGRDKPFDVTWSARRSSSVRSNGRSRTASAIININTFSRQRGDATKAAIMSIDKATGGHPLGYVVDLRSNPGGLLDQAIDVTDAFLDSGEIVSQRGRDKDDIERYYAKSGRHGPWPSGHRADRRRHRFGIGDRRRRAAGSPPRADHGRAQLRQGLGPDGRPDRPTARCG